MSNECFIYFLQIFENGLVQLQDAAFYGIKVYVVTHISIKKHDINFLFFWDESKHPKHSFSL